MFRSEIAEEILRHRPRVVLEDGQRYTQLPTDILEGVAFAFGVAIEPPPSAAGWGILHIDRVRMCAWYPTPGVVR